MRDVVQDGCQALVRVGRPVNDKVGTPRFDDRWPIPDSLPINQPEA